MLLLPEQDLTPGLAAVDRLRRKIGQAGVGTAGGSCGLTISGGVTAFDPDEPREPAALILDAGRALYRAKAPGRNIVLGQGSEPRRP